MSSGCGRYKVRNHYTREQMGSHLFIWLFRKLMSEYLNIKITNDNLPRGFIIMNSRRDNSIPHWIANGYVAINKRYSVYWKSFFNTDLYKLDVHGGITFSESLAECKTEHPHIYDAYLQLPNTHDGDEVRIVWFDTNHRWDTDAERDKDAIERETNYLVKQLLQFYVPTQEDIDEARRES